MSQQSTVHGPLGEVAVSSLGHDPKLHEAVATSVSLAARGLKPIAQLAANRDHGNRVRYLAGCRCTDCRRANSAYESARQKARAAGDWNGFVLATRRAHLKDLSSKNVGRRAVSAASDVAESIVFAIASGTKTHIRARTG
jgi:hypothetical protein